MKKVINDPSNVVEETIEGFLVANKEYEKVEGVTGIVRKELKDKVAVLVGGGSGHEPLFFNLIGSGLADGLALGNVFAAPTPNTIVEVAKKIDSGKGVIFVYGNYAGDILNFDMAAELLEMEGIETRTVRVSDDVASAPADRKDDRRGIAGDIFIMKTAGAASEKGLSLDEVTRITQKANDYTTSMGVALAPGTIPGATELPFVIADDEIEIGLGVHGEPGIETRKMMPADKMVDLLMDKLLSESNLENDKNVAVLVNGLGSTTLMELLIVNRRVAQILDENGIKIHDMEVGSFITTQEMAGFSITLLELDKELQELYDAPAVSPYYVKLPNKETVKY
ncbi:MULTISPECIES: dihydroxyacetone kinase subunit DhaK [Oceanobacillus]|uniref:dihydroxyacetone kinase subunit DhaK n=1 Tax=Oceanobacillus TaxID=182709 RepID=UPI0030FAD62E